MLPIIDIIIIEKQAIWKDTYYHPSVSIASQLLCAIITGNTDAHPKNILEPAASHQHILSGGDGYKELRGA